MSIHLEKKLTVQIPYFAAQHLFPEGDRTGYSYGPRGWNCDIYDLPELQVRTSYRVRGKEIPSGLYADLDEKAKSAQDVGSRFVLRLEFQYRVLAYLLE